MTTASAGAHRLAGRAGTGWASSASISSGFVRGVDPRRSKSVRGLIQAVRSRVELEGFSGIRLDPITCNDNRSGQAVRSGREKNSLTILQPVAHA
jgi:hypothetical protein